MSVPPLIMCGAGGIQIKMASAGGARDYRFQLQMPPDLHGQTWIRVSRA